MIRNYLLRRYLLATLVNVVLKVNTFSSVEVVEGHTNMEVEIVVEIVRLEENLCNVQCFTSILYNIAMKVSR